MRAIFLDIDGVLNDHKPHPNGYCGLTPSAVSALALVLDLAPDARVVLSSAWRYIVHAGHINTKGFEYLMCIFGMPYDLINGRIVGCTDSDEAICQTLGILDVGAELDYLFLKDNGHEIRVLQIEAYAAAHGITDYVVLDDLPLPTARLVQTDPDRGLVVEQVPTILDMLCVSRQGYSLSRKGENDYQKEGLERGEVKNEK